MVSVISLRRSQLGGVLPLSVRYCLYKMLGVICDMQRPVLHNLCKDIHYISKGLALQRDALHFAVSSVLRPIILSFKTKSVTYLFAPLSIKPLYNGGPCRSQLYFINSYKTYSITPLFRLTPNRKNDEQNFGLSSGLYGQTGPE